MKWWLKASGGFVRGYRVHRMKCECNKILSKVILCCVGYEVRWLLCMDFLQMMLRIDSGVCME